MDLHDAKQKEQLFAEIAKRKIDEIPSELKPMSEEEAARQAKEHEDRKAREQEQKERGKEEEVSTGEEKKPEEKPAEELEKKPEKKEESEEEEEFVLDEKGSKIDITTPEGKRLVKNLQFNKEIKEKLEAKEKEMEELQAKLQEAEEKKEQKQEEDDLKKAGEYNFELKEFQMSRKEAVALWKKAVDEAEDEEREKIELDRDLYWEERRAFETARQLRSMTKSLDPIMEQNRDTERLKSIKGMSDKHKDIEAYADQINQELVKNAKKYAGMELTEQITAVYSMKKVADPEKGASYLESVANAGRGTSVRTDSTTVPGSKSQPVAIRQAGGQEHRALSPEQREIVDTGKWLTKLPGFAHLSEQAEILERKAK